MTPARHFLTPLLGSAAVSRSRLVNLRTQTVLASSLELAADSAGRRQGLLGRSSLPPGHALIIAPSSGIHTFGMRFSIDVAFLSRSGRVSKVRSHLGPARLCLSPGAFAVIELPAGTLDTADTLPGDVLQILASDTASLASA